MGDSALRMFGWLIFAWGAGIIAIALFSSGARVRSPARRIADVLSGVFFCLLASTVIVSSDAPSSTRIALLIGAGVAGLVSWVLGRHARQVDRATHRK